MAGGFACHKRAQLAEVALREQVLQLISSAAPQRLRLWPRAL